MRVIKRRRQSSGTASTAQAIMPNRMPAQSPKSHTYDGLSVAEATVAYLSTLPERETEAPAESVSKPIGEEVDFFGPIMTLEEAQALRKGRAISMEKFKARFGLE